MGPLRNVSLTVSADAETQNQLLGPNKKDIVAGLQFAFDLPYKGFFNITPLYYQETNHNALLSPVFAPPGFPGVTSGVASYDPTWAVEMNYYMDLNFLPPNLQYFAVSGRAGFYGPKGTGVPAGSMPVQKTVTELNSEPIRLTLDAGKLFWGEKFSHFADVWVAYRYWNNKFGLDANNPLSPCFRNGVNTNSCTEKTLYSGVTVKF